MATKSGTLVNNVKSPYSGPYVHYSAAYTSTRANSSSKSISVSLTFKAWLDSSASKLGTGIILTVYARISGGAWKSVTIKGNDASWGGTTKHSAIPITLTGNSTADKITVEFYVARGDSGGKSGKLGTKSNPKQYSAMLPAYSNNTPAPEPTSQEEYGAYYNVNGTWKASYVFINNNNTWTKSEPNIKINNTWMEGVI